MRNKIVNFLTIAPVVSGLCLLLLVLPGIIATKWAVNGFLLIAIGLLVHMCDILGGFSKNKVTKRSKD
jgi:hypothetical protein